MFRCWCGVVGVFVGLLSPDGLQRDSVETIEGGVVELRGDGGRDEIRPVVAYARCRDNSQVGSVAHQRLANARLPAFVLEIFRDVLVPAREGVGGHLGYAGLVNNTEPEFG